MLKIEPFFRFYADFWEFLLSLGQKCLFLDEITFTYMKSYATKKIRAPVNECMNVDDSMYM